MSVLVCGGKLTYPIKVSTDKLGIIGVSYVEQLKDYLKYNKHISKLIYLETVDNEFKEDDIEGFTGEVTVITNNPSKYLKDNEQESNGDEGGIPLSDSVKELIIGVKTLEGIRVSDIQWEIMNS